jgi:hypothetical protein
MGEGQDEGEFDIKNCIVRMFFLFDGRREYGFYSLSLDGRGLRVRVNERNNLPQRRFDSPLSG